MITKLITNKGLIPKANWRSLLWRYPPKYLKMILDERVWNGTPSVTTCNRCPREYIFRQLYPYAVDPEDFAFSTLGTMVHAVLEDDDTAIFSEERMHIKMETSLSGILDLAYVHNGEIYLDDYKTWGSYAVAKHMGMTKKTRPMVDMFGNPVLYLNSRKGKWEKGDPRTETYYEPDPTKAEKHDVEMQLNMYRLMLEDLLRRGVVTLEGVIGPKVVKHMKVFAIVRDGNTQVAKGRGVMSQTYAIPIDKLPDQEVLDYFSPRAKYITDYMNDAEFSTHRQIMANPPRMGTPKETLDGYLCRVTCPVSYLCKHCEEHPVDAERPSPMDSLFNIQTGMEVEDESAYEWPIE